MGLYGDHVLPRLVDKALSGRTYDRLRTRVTAGLSGEVLEIGFGSGRNVPHYPSAVTGVRAVEPSGVSRKLATERLEASAVPIEFVGSDGERLPVEDATIDHVLSTWTLCSIPDVAQALREIRRVLRPGGALHFLEHGRSPDASVAAWQDRLTPLQKRFAGGCHLNRPIGELVASSGLHVTELENFYLPGPRVATYMFEGVATKP